MDRYEIFKTLQDDDLFDTNLEPFESEITARLNKYGFKYRTEDESIIYSMISTPSKKEIERSIADTEDAKKFLESDLCDYLIMDGYKAIANAKTNHIECLLIPLIPTAPTIFRNASLRRSIREPIVVTHPDNDEIQISIAQVSKELCVAARCPEINISISISGINIESNARELLERYSTSLFFQMDMLDMNSYALAKEINTEPTRRPSRPYRLRSKLKFPELELESGPSSLYWYGRAAAQMPLLRFLAYYQVVEFYFPRFSKKNAHQKIKNILKDPTFRPSKDSDIERILKAIKLSGSGKIGDEKAQLSATISECIDADELLEFVLQDDAHKSHFCSGKDTELSKFKISPTDKSQTHNAVANRLYEIRCKIVHTKNDHEDGTPAVLLPGSDTANKIGLDISLMKFIAQKVLIHTGSEISISTRPKILKNSGTV